MRPQRAATRTPLETMRGCLFPPWHTEEVLALFEYVRETQRTARPLVLAGFDVQTSSAVDSDRPAFLRRVVAAADSGFAARVFAVDSAFRVIDQRGGSPAPWLPAFYDSLAAWLRPREGALAAAFPDEPTAPALARQTARSMARYARELAAEGAPARIAIRDRGMADNLDFLLDELHPGRKVIVWAQNFHVRHGGWAPGVVGPPRLDGYPRTMGTYVAERHRPELYTIGLYMYRGSLSERRKAVEVTGVRPRSLEAILHRAPWRYAFVDLSRAAPGPGTGWMSRPLVAKAGGTILGMLVPRDEYDGLVFIDATWPPRFLSPAGEPIVP